MELIPIKSLKLVFYQFFTILKRIGNVLPYLVSLIGVLLDYLTTTVGLSLGLHETNSLYHPVLSLIIFWVILTFMNLALPRKGLWNICKNVYASTPFLAAFSNILVITSVFRN